MKSIIVLSLLSVFSNVVSSQEEKLPKINLIYYSHQPKNTFEQAMSTCKKYTNRFQEGESLASFGAEDYDKVKKKIW